MIVRQARLKIETRRHVNVASFLPHGNGCIGHLLLELLGDELKPFAGRSACLTVWHASLSASHCRFQSYLAIVCTPITQQSVMPWSMH